MYPELGNSLRKVRVTFVRVFVENRFTRFPSLEGFIEKNVERVEGSRDIYEMRQSLMGLSTVYE